MVGKFTGHDVPACGFSIGFERIVLLLMEQGFKIPEDYDKVVYLIEKGVEPLLIKERLGHKDIRITLNTYGHLYPNKARSVADLIDNNHN